MPKPYGFPSGDSGGMFHGFPPGLRRLPPTILGYEIGGSGTGTCTVNKPAATKSGCLLIANGGFRDRAWTLPTDWFDVVPKIAGGTSEAGQLLAYKIATDNEPTSYGFANALNNATALIVAIDNVDVDDPFASISYVYNTGGVTAIPDAFIGVDDALALAFIAASSASNGSDPVITFTAGPYTKFAENNTLASQRASNTVGYYYPPEPMRITGATVSATNSNPEFMAVVTLQGPVTY